MEQLIVHFQLTTTEMVQEESVPDCQGWAQRWKEEADAWARRSGVPKKEGPRVWCEAAPVLYFDVPEAESSRGLILWTAQSGRQSLYMMDDIKGTRTNAVRGYMTWSEALRTLLEGTGLSYVVYLDTVLPVRTAR